MSALGFQGNSWPLPGPQGRQLGLGQLSEALFCPWEEPGAASPAWHPSPPPGPPCWVTLADGALYRGASLAGWGARPLLGFLDSPTAVTEPENLRSREARPGTGDCPQPPGKGATTRLLMGIIGTPPSWSPAPGPASCDLDLPASPEHFLPKSPAGRGSSPQCW